MLTIISLSVVLGVAAAAPQLFSPEPIELTAARQNFINEYNRLAKLAADAPDIHIIMSNRLPHQQPAVAPSVEQNPAVSPIFDQFSFNTNLGSSQLFNPASLTFPAAGGQLAGHLAGHNVPAPTAPLRWTGELAHTIPAGVNGLPTQVVETQAVKLAKDAHFRAHDRALRLVAANTV